jgi:hypothetical protein
MADVFSWEGGLPHLAGVHCTTKAAGKKESAANKHVTLGEVFRRIYA